MHDYQTVLLIPYSLSSCIRIKPYFLQVNIYLSHREPITVETRYSGTVYLRRLFMADNTNSRSLCHVETTRERLARSQHPHGIILQRGNLFEENRQDTLLNVE